MSHAPQGERYAHIASHIDGVVFDSTPIQNRAINGANAMAAVPGVPSLLWPLWWGALALWWHVLAGYCYPPGYRDVSKRAGDSQRGIGTTAIVCLSRFLADTTRVGIPGQFALDLGDILGEPL